MGLIENIKGLFKPKLTFEQLAIVIASDVRQAIIKELELPYEGASGRDFEETKQRVSDRMNREVSGGSLTWHLEKLRDSDLIEESLGPYEHDISMYLTSSGKEALKLLKKVDREPEEAEV